MASVNKQPRYSRDEVVAMILGESSSDSDNSDVDSATGGISSAEEYILDQDLGLEEDASDRQSEASFQPHKDIADAEATSDEDEDEDGPAPQAQPRRGRGRGQTGRGRGQAGRVSGRGRARAARGGSVRGRGRVGRVRPAARARGVGPIQPHENGYETPDIPNQLPPFSPTRPPGVHLQAPLLRGSMNCAVDFFKLFFTFELMTAAESENEKLYKICGFISYIRDRSMALYQPFQQVAVDERMVRSKHRSGIKQYMQNKPVKWGIKLWVLADSANGYTYSFDVYTGKRAGHQPSANGLAYDTVMNLGAPLLHQGYHFYFDNFYTSVRLVKELFAFGTPSTGTAVENRRGFPESMKKGKDWGKHQQRGNMRWARDGVCLAQQWKDNRAVTVLSSIDNANTSITVQRRERENDRWRTLQVRQPKTINNYNHFMNGVDRSDQLLANNHVLRKCMRWWKTLFFHMVDIAVVNSYILFQLHRAEHSENVLLHRPGKYGIVEFREELCRQLVGLDEYGPPPVFRPPKMEPGVFDTVHILGFSEKKRNCKVCYATTKKEFKVTSFCKAPQCQVYLHCTSDKNCFEVWHSREYHKEI